MPLKNIKERKRELRAYYKKLRAECPQDIKQDLDKELTQKFLLLDEYKNCDTLFAFVSMPIECDTSKIIDNALLDNKRVALPKCKNKSGIMDFYFINSNYYENIIFYKYIRYLFWIIFKRNFSMYRIKIRYSSLFLV